jgi:hypothetical protein
VILLAGCDRAEQVRCRLEPGAQVAESDGSGFDALAIATYGQRPLAAWSDVSGVWLKWLDATEPPTRAGTWRCRGGMALAFASKEQLVWLACLSPAHGDESGNVSIEPFGLDLSRAPSEWARGGQGSTRSGRDAQGVSLALAGDRAYLVWGDGEVGNPQVRFDSLPLNIAPIPGHEPEVLSTPHSNAREPDMLMHEGVRWVVWVESDLTPGKMHHWLMLKRGQAAARRLVEVTGDSPMPKLATDDHGESATPSHAATRPLMLSYRAAKKAGARPELFMARLAASGDGFIEPPHAIGRANSVGGPSLAACARTRAALVPLDHAGELYVAFHPLSRTLRSTEENHQYYVSGRDLVQTVSACVGDYPLALLAEQTGAARPGARLLTATFRCSE